MVAAKRVGELMMMMMMMMMMIRRKNGFGSDVGVDRSL